METKQIIKKYKYIDDNTNKFKSGILFAGTTKSVSVSWILLFFVQSLYLLNSFWINIFFTSFTVLL